MDEKLALFNQQFPNSSYREVHPQSTTGSIKDYQDSKAPLNNNIVSFDAIKNTPNRIGWIVPKEYIVVDVDDRKDASIIYEILKSTETKFSYMTGKHGGHFIFRNQRGVGQGVKLLTGLSIRIDTRSMEKGYIILPYNDTDRKWGDISSDVSELPYFLVPLRDAHLSKTKDFVLMEEGSRNTELLKHFLNLKDYGNELTLDEKVNCIKLINRFVLSKPLTDKELSQTVLRDAMINKPSKLSEKKNKGDILEEIASRILEDKNIICCTDVLYMYNGKYYEMMDEKELERMIHEEYGKGFEEKDRKEIIKFVKLKTWVNTSEVNKNWNEIVCKNGVLNISTMTLYPHTPLKYNTIYIDYDFKNPAVYSSIIDNFLNTISNRDELKKKLLIEMIGYCLIQRNVFSKFFICYGEGCTGKSTYLTMIKQLIGENNTTFLGLNDLEKEFMPAELFGKLVNIGDDINFKGLTDTSILKKLVSGEKVLARHIYGSPFSFNNFAKLIFTTNRLPTVSDRTSGFYRRLVIVDIDTKIENPDPFFLDKLTEADYEYLFYIAVVAIRDAIARNSLTTYAGSEKNLNKFKIDQSSTLSFLDYCSYDKAKLTGKSCRQIYEEYKVFCDDAGYKALNRRHFQEEVCDEYNLRIVNTTIPGESQQWRFR